MAIKVSGTTVIDDSRQLSNIASVDATTVAALGTAGVGGGGGLELTAGENVVEGDTLAFDVASGKVMKVHRTGGNRNANVYDSANTQNIQLYDVIKISAINKFAVLGALSNGNTVVMVGEINSSGVFTWGTSWSGDFNSNRAGSKLVYDVSASRLVAIYKTSNGHTIGRLFSISGNNVTNEGASTMTQATHNVIATQQQIVAVYSPTHQRIIVAYCKDNVQNKYRICVGNVSSSSISWVAEQGPDGGNLSNGGEAIRNVGIAVNGSTIVFCGRQANNGTNFAYAATMSGSTLTFGSAHSWNFGSEQDYRGQVFHVSHTSQHSNRFAYMGQDAQKNPRAYHFDVSGTTISNAQNYSLAGNSGSSSGFATAYDPANNRTYSFNRYIQVWIGSDSNDMRQTTDEGSGLTGIQNGYYGNIRSIDFDPVSGFAVFIGAQNPTKIYSYALQQDNYHTFVGTALEAASANNTVKIASVGMVATGLSGLTAGNVYRINYDGTWSNQGGASSYNYFFGEAQRARNHMFALTSTTGIIFNQFSQDL